MNIIIGGHDEKWNVQITRILEGDTVHHTIEIEKKGTELLKHIKTSSPELVIVDMLMPEIDGIGIIEEVLESEKDVPDFLLVVPAAMKERMHCFQNLKKTWVIEKPVEESVLLGAVHSLMKSDKKKWSSNTFVNMHMINGMMQEDLEILVTNVIHDVGIPAHIKGYRYLRYAILLAVQDMDILNSITKQLYPAIAKEFETTADRVERAIRHAIIVAWERGMPEQMQEYFGYALKQGSGKPTNSEFIAMIADKIRLESKIKSA